MDRKASRETLLAGKPIKSVKVSDLLNVLPSKSSTYILKVDVEGYDCKVIFQKRMWQ